jgi:hypothetical protein
MPRVLRRRAKELEAQQQGHDKPAEGEPSDSKKGLLEAALAWKPDGPPLEEHPAAQGYVNEDSANVKKVRLLEAILSKHRKAQPGGDDTPGVGR